MNVALESVQHRNERSITIKLNRKAYLRCLFSLCRIDSRRSLMMKMKGDDSPPSADHYLLRYNGAFSRLGIFFSESKYTFSVVTSLKW